MAENEKEFGLEFVNVRLNHDRTLYADTPITSASSAVEFLKSEMVDYDREHFALLSLDAKGRVINASIISVGDISSVPIHPREVFKVALLSNASAVLFLHNHPSGVSNPSREDKILTTRLVAAGKVLGIKVVDHIIVGHNEYFSFLGEGLLDNAIKAAESWNDIIDRVREDETTYEAKEKKESFRDRVAAEFIKSLEEDPKTWVKKWASNDTGRPFNMASGREYNGLNAAWLKFIEKQRGFRDPRWLTFNQVKKLNETREEDNKIKVPKGTKMTQVEYFFMWDHLNKKTIPWEEYNRLSPEERSQRVDGEGNLVTDPSLMGTKIKERFELRSRDHYVFNASQLENMPEYVYDRVQNDIAPSEVVNRIASGMGVKIREEEQNRAFYRPSIDTITLPLKSQFESDYDYQSTALHELGHATGHESRLNRNIRNEFGSPEYAYEELIAEMTSCFMGEYVESPMNDQDLDNHIAYVQNWIDAIKNDKNYLFRAIKEADKAADYMIEKGSLEELKERVAEETISSSNIAIEGYEGTWYVVAVDSRNGEPVFELEHEEYGDEAAHLIVDKDTNIIYDDIWNGFDEMRERDEIKAEILKNDALLKEREIQKANEQNKEKDAGELNKEYSRTLREFLLENQNSRIELRTPDEVFFLTRGNIDEYLSDEKHNNILEQEIISTRNQKDDWGFESIVVRVGEGAFKEHLVGSFLLSKEAEEDRKVTQYEYGEETGRVEESKYSWGFTEYRDSSGFGSEILFESKQDAVNHAREKWEAMSKSDKESYLKDPAATFSVGYWKLAWDDATESYYIDLGEGCNPLVWNMGDYDKSYIEKEIMSEVEKLNHKLIYFDKAYVNPRDSYLFTVLAYNEKQDNYTTWSYNADVGGLSLGHYGLSEESGRLDFYERMDEALRPPYRISEYSGEYTKASVKALGSEELIEDELSKVTVIAYAKTLEEGKNLIKGMSSSVSNSDDSNYVVIKQIALEELAYDSDGDLVSKEIILTTDKPVEYNPEERVLKLTTNGLLGKEQQIYATFTTPGDSNGLKVSFGGRSYIDGFRDFCKDQIKDNVSFWKYAFERDVVSAKEALVKMYLDDAPGTLDKELPEPLSLTEKEKETVKDFFKEIVPLTVPDYVLEDWSNEYYKESLSKNEPSSEMEGTNPLTSGKEKVSDKKKDQDEEI